jgi:hypothetical protein
MTRTLILVLVIALTIFAVDAKAITCTPLPSDCTGCDGSGSASVTLQIPGPGGTINCVYDFCYCWECPELNDPPNTPMKIKVWNIDATYGCPDADVSQVYDLIRDYAVKIIGASSSNCGTVPPCTGPPPNYKYISYEVSACWYAINTGGNVYFKPCPGCTSYCITVYRLCMYGGELITEVVSNTLVGSVECGADCELYHPIPFWPNPGYQTPCYHICH